MRSTLWALKFVFLFWLSLGTSLNAQELGFDLNFDQLSMTNTSVSLIVLLTVLSLAPAILMMVTCFPFMVTVLAILRQAIGLQQSPPHMMMVGFSLFLTWFVMEPVFLQAWTEGIEPYANEAIGFGDAVAKATGPFYDFMRLRVDPDTLYAIQTTAEPDVAPDAQEPSFAQLSVSFLISELTRAFKIGFMIFLPFLIIDLVVSAVLMSMGMMMVPPTVVALPFKLGFFVVADGWSLVSMGLVQGYG